MTCDVGRLQAYLDDALASEERVAVETHLAACDVCQDSLAALRRQEQELSTWLTALDPEPWERTHASEALARFQARSQPARASRLRTVKERIEMMKQTLLTGRWRPATIGLVVLAFLVALFSFAPARQAAAQFLRVFRVRQFAVIPVDPAQVERLESLGDLVDSGMLGEPTVLREAGERQTVADADEASSMAGFDVRELTGLPEGGELREFSVEAGPAMRIDVDPAMMQFALEAAGVPDVTLPLDETIPVEVDFPTVVEQTYGVGAGKLMVVQMPSPVVNFPSEVDPAMMGEALLQVLGMPAGDAQRLAQSIDWTSTMVIPLPTDVGRFREVEVDGVTGLLLEERRENQYQRQHKMVLWQRDGLVYSVQGENVDATELLRLANSLQ